MSFNLLGYSIFAFATAITPGPNNVLLLSLGKKFGFTKAIPAMAGIFTGFLTLLILSGYGVSSIITRYPSIALGLKVISSLWLLYLAYLIMHVHKIDVDQEHKPIKMYQTFLMQFINPKAWIMAINGAAVFLPNFSSIHINVAVFATVYILIGIPCMMSWVLSGQIISKLVDSPKANKVVGYVLAVLMLVCILTIWI